MCKGTDWETECKAPTKHYDRGRHRRGQETGVIREDVLEKRKSETNTQGQAGVHKQREEEDFSGQRGREWVGDGQ